MVHKKRLIHKYDSEKLVTKMIHKKMIQKLIHKYDSEK